jgi:hypothetical protein
MNIQTISGTSSRTHSPIRDCCEDKCPAGPRNRYFLGKRLTPHSFGIEQRYGIERRRLINRAIHGWGVVYGFALSTAATGKQSPLEAGELSIGEGFALDRFGRELIQLSGVIVTLDNVLILGADGKPVEVDGCDLGQRLEALNPDPEHCWLLSAHYAEKEMEPVELRDPCSCDRREWDQICETIVYSLQRIDCNDCCVPWHCQLDCSCAPDTPCCAGREHDREDIDRARRELSEAYEKRIEAAGGDREAIAELRAEYERELDALGQKLVEVHGKIHPRGGCACLCDHLTELQFDTQCAALRDVGDCTRADVAHGVALACLRLARDDCGHWAIGAVADACGPRRLVKRNDLLFDLINGCDLTRIDGTGWAAWHRREEPVPFDAFIAALGWSGDSPYADYPTKDFWVRFSRPVRLDTLKPDIFSVVVTSDHGDDFWRRSYRVPILGIDTDEVPAEPGDPAGYARSARIVVSTAWLKNAVTDDDTIFAQGETRVEISFFGDLVEDCLGQTVDANTRARSPYPSGGGEPGDTYFSSFTVARRVAPQPTETRPPAKGRRPTAAAS